VTIPVRAPFQVLVLPYRRWTSGGFQYAIFRRSDDDSWQGLAGGGEDDESPIAAARREAREEASIPHDAKYVSLDTISSVPVTGFRDSLRWGSDRYVIEEHTFGVDMTGREIAFRMSTRSICGFRTPRHARC
jgi:dihydroneopterin triphosphate diphosphatase